MRFWHPHGVNICEQWHPKPIGNQTKSLKIACKLFHSAAEAVVRFQESVPEQIGWIRVSF